MELVAIVATLALLEYAYFVMRTGAARGRHGVPAPAMSGNTQFERNVRVQENTIEQLVIFLPALPMFAFFVSAPAAAALGLVFVVGRALYARAYVNDPSKRGVGFMLTFGSNLALVVGALIGATLAWL